MIDFFEQVNVLPRVRENLQKMGIKTPMPVQRQAIPALLKGRDVLAREMPFILVKEIYACASLAAHTVTTPQLVDTRHSRLPTLCKFAIAITPPLALVVVLVEGALSRPLVANPRPMTWDIEKGAANRPRRAKPGHVAHGGGCTPL